MLSSVASDAAAASGAKPSMALRWRVSTRRAGAAASDADRQRLLCVTSAASQAAAASDAWRVRCHSVGRVR
jgi:hypothetical protein